MLLTKEHNKPGDNRLKQLYNYFNKEHYAKIGKRFWDLGAALPILACIMPLFAVLALLVKLDSQGPVFYKQKRVGKNGKLFDCYKFRTMKVGSDKESPTTSDHDPRITRVGRIIRPISLDELPQIINIIKGDMSFIGPRPLSKHEFDMLENTGLFDKEFINGLIPQVRPGILGWAIFNGREKISYEDRRAMNNEYENKMSLSFDSYISFLTLKKYWLSYCVVITMFIAGSIFALEALEKAIIS